jgi:membrane carboxypeptidase/penicillin-binding protein
MINYAVDKAMRNSNGIQAGSAFKPFVLAAALNQGLEPDLELDAPAQIDVSGEWFEACWNDQTRVRDMDYEPANSTRGGRITRREATEWSTNTYYIRLLQRTGICEPARIAESSGVWKQVPDTSERQPLDQVPSFPLGSNTVAPLAMAEAFAMFANRGEHCASFAVAEVVDRDGDILIEQEPECDRVRRVMPCGWTGAGRPPARPARRTEASRCGSSATRHSCRPRPPLPTWTHRRPPLAAEPITGSASRRLTAAPCPGRSGGKP